LRQGGNGYLLIFQQPFRAIYHAGMTWLWVPNAFQAKKRRFIVVSSGPGGTTVYLDGVPAERSRTFKITQKDLSGQLIVGTSPIVYDAWRGKLFGLAVFGKELTPSQVSEHYRAWLDRRSDAIQNNQPVALYAFRERTGNTVHSQIASGPDLTLPDSFHIPYKALLKAPWDEFYPKLA